MSPVVKVLQPSGLLDGTKATQVRQEIDDILDQRADIVLIDLKDVTFIDSSGLGALVSALKAVRSAGGKLFICSINTQVRMLFELTSMDRVFQIFKNQDEFTGAVLHDKLKS
jgi:anti-anti-sigma factor